MSVAFTASILVLSIALQGSGGMSVGGGKTLVWGANHVGSLECDGRKATISGIENTITLTGVCKTLEVSGVGHSVDAAIAPGGRLVVSGSEHRIRWRSTGEIRRQVGGVDNQVVQVK
ncbi:DUF3060 domain-containing protein [Caulobacter sp. 602-2]|uniref:DUF3060 domain-containing protein n=1 Tax=Caulobacter sp. 602-2 TaxID=2710887 RepID=A0A6G4R1N6_9CAUL|nr:DUF3060 domain-containing protein [Caulobacter sp. 602-2]NGM51702.1 DUF3060 domain-containing protein [Caulobacter sp. 602-2]